MSGDHLDRSKTRPEHLERAAFVYVRQSSLKQVRENVEGRRRQRGDGICHARHQGVLLLADAPAPEGSQPGPMMPLCQWGRPPTHTGERRSGRTRRSL